MGDQQQGHAVALRIPNANNERDRDPKSIVRKPDNGYKPGRSLTTVQPERGSGTPPDPHAAAKVAKRAACGLAKHGCNQCAKRPRPPSTAPAPVAEMPVGHEGGGKHAAPLGARGAPYDPDQK